MAVPIAQGIYAAAKLNLAQLLENGARTAEELAEPLHVDPDALRRLLRMLVSVGVVTSDMNERFSLTATGLCLRDDEPGSIRDLAILGGEPWHLEPWAHLLDSIRTGTPAFDQTHGCSFFEFLSARPECADVFDRAMDVVVGRFASAVAAVCELRSGSTVVDIGGGRGTLLGLMLARDVTLRGVLFDTPSTISTAEHRLRTLGVLDRCTLVAGDFFAGVPCGGDVYVLSHVLHSWNDDSAVRILTNCRRAMHGTARLLVVEVVVNAAPDLYRSWLDLEMLVNCGGKERAQHEYECLFEQAGFRLVSTMPTESSVTVITTAPV
jgi:hypothetical protein